MAITFNHLASSPFDNEDVVRPLTRRGHQRKSLRRSANSVVRLEPVSASAGDCGELGMISGSEIGVFNFGSHGEHFREAMPFPVGGK